jgi:hypothetical protein
MHHLAAVMSNQWSSCSCSGNWWRLGMYAEYEIWTAERSWNWLLETISHSRILSPTHQPETIIQMIIWTYHSVTDAVKSRLLLVEFEFHLQPTEYRSSGRNKKKQQIYRQRYHCHPKLVMQLTAIVPGETTGRVSSYATARRNERQTTKPSCDSSASLEHVLLLVQSQGKLVLTIPTRSKGNPIFRKSQLTCMML